jgi:uncharacterized protein involved in outer membrane biogenesis
MRRLTLRGWSGLPRRHPVWTAALGFLLLVVVLLACLDWNWAKGPVQRVVSGITAREFRIDGDLDVDFMPLEVRAEKLYLGNAGWASEPAMARVRRIHLRVRFWPLLAGRFTLPLLELEGATLHLERSPEGVGNWMLAGSSPTCSQPPCRQRLRVLQLLVHEGRVHFTEPALMTSLDVDVESARPARPREPAPLTLRGKGSYRDAPFRLEGRIDSPLELQTGGAPYRLDLTATAGDARARAYGALPEPLRTRNVAVNFEMSGQDLAELDRFAGLVLPDTPPYSLKGSLSTDGLRVAYRNFTGKVGDSDLSGDAEVDFSGERPRLTATLTSKLLDFDDLAGFVGGTPGTGEGETASESQKQAAGKQRSSGKKLPSRPLQLERLRRMDADVRLTAARVQSPRLPLESMRAHLKLDDGLLVVDPLQFGAAGGSLASRMRFDTRRDPARMEWATDVRKLELPKLFPRAEVMKDSLGTFAGVVQLQGEGDSAARILASSNGAMSLIMGQGRVSNLLLELAGLDIAEALKFLIGKDRQVTIRCAYADFEVSDGVAHARSVAFDTTDTALLVRGDFSFRDESLDLELLPKPKDASPLSVRTPLKIGGTFADPRLSVEGGPLVLRGGALAALIAIAPPLGLLALIETGEGEDTDCGRSVAPADAEPPEEPARAGPRRPPPTAPRQSAPVPPRS